MRQDRVVGRPVLFLPLDFFGNEAEKRRNGRLFAVPILAAIRPANGGSAGPPACEWGPPNVQESAVRRLSGSTTDR